MALHVLDEANRCLGCKKPMCQEGCPIHTNIPEVIRLLKANQMDDAGRMLFENNPLTTVCSLVCNHEKQCEGHCIRNRMPSHDPVHFSIIEDYISTTYANKMTAGPAPKNGMKAAVVGSGPAGLTIAVLLARWGYDVTIFDARDKIGGVMRYGIPNYRLPDSVLDDFQYRHLELKGIKVRPNTTIGKTITIDDLFRDGYKSVFIGAGLWKANAMHIKGESLGNVAFGIDYLANSKAFRLGDDVAVIGVGNSAMDCARTAIRNGARHVTCYARRDESCISASEYEVSYAKLEGVGFRFCKAPVEIRENGLICRDTVKGEDGKFTQVEGSETFYPHTGVIVSVSQGSESNLVKTTTGIETNQKGLLSVSEDGRTTREGVFAGGDAVMGARTVVEAVAVAKKVAVAMDEYMKSLPADTAAAARTDRGQILYLVAVNGVIVAENVIGLLVVILDPDHHVHDVKVCCHARRTRAKADYALDGIGYLDLASPCIGHNAHFLRGVFLCSVLLRGRSALLRCSGAPAGSERQQRRKREYYRSYFFGHLFFPPLYLSGAEVIGLRSAYSS